jgi:hypothetical protein
VERIGSSGSNRRTSARPVDREASCSRWGAHAPALGPRSRRSKRGAAERRWLRRNGNRGSGWRAVVPPSGCCDSHGEPDRLAPTPRKRPNRRRSRKPPQPRGARRDSMRPPARGCVSPNAATRRRGGAFPAAQWLCGFVPGAWVWGVGATTAPSLGFSRRVACAGSVSW